MDPRIFQQGRWYKEGMCIEAPPEVSICQLVGPNGKLVERTYDYVIASNGLVCKMENMAVVGFFESSPRKAVTFHVEKDRETPVVRELNAPKALPGFSGGRKVGRRKTEGRLEEGGVEDEKRRTEMEDVQAAKLAANAAESSRVHEEPHPQAKFG